jgi:sialate O-acetylesterase
MVRNFGLSGATMIHDGSPNVWQQLDGIKRYLPQVVIIIIGTNETVSGNRRNWEHIDNFKKDYADFLQQLQSLASHPVIFICSPTDMNLKTTGLSAERSGDLTLRRPRLWELRKRIKSIARESSVNFIDLTPRFKNRPALFTPGDGVHPNKQGYYYLAELIFKNIKANVYNLLK